MIARWQVRKNVFHSLYCFTLSPLFDVPWMLILLSFTDSLSFAFISNRLSVWLTRLNKGERDPRPVPQKEMIKEGGREERDPPTGSSASHQITHTHSFTPFFLLLMSLFHPFSIHSFSFYPFPSFRIFCFGQKHDYSKAFNVWVCNLPSSNLTSWNRK